MRYSLFSSLLHTAWSTKTSQEGQAAILNDRSHFLLAGGWNQWGGSTIYRRKIDEQRVRRSSEMINDHIDDRGTPQQEKLQLGSPQEMKCGDHTFFWLHSSLSRGRNKTSPVNVVLQSIKTKIAYILKTKTPYKALWIALWSFTPPSKATVIFTFSGLVPDGAKVEKKIPVCLRRDSSHEIRPVRATPAVTAVTCSSAQSRYSGPSQSDP